MAGYKILVPLDGSRTAEHALVYLQAFKHLADCQVRLLAVADETEDFHHEHAEEAVERERNLLSTYLREVAGDVEQHAGVTVDAKVVRGVPSARIAEEVTSFQPDLLIICTHGRTGVSRWRLGSVADKVIRGAACNTLVIGPTSFKEEAWIDAGIEQPFKQILLPLDGSELANQAVPLAVSLANAFGSTLHLVRVVNLAYGGSFIEGGYIPDYTDALMNGASEHLRLTEGQIGPGVPVRTAVLVGDAASRLQAYAEEHAIQLIAMTTHGRGGVLRTALGSVADRLLTEAGAPILIVRAGS